MAKRRVRSKLKSKTPDRELSLWYRMWTAGVAAMGNERWEEATSTFHKLLKQADAPYVRGGVFANLSYCYLEWGRYDEALAMWAQTDEARDETEHWFSQAMIYGCSGQPAKAMEALETFRQRMPAAAEALGVNYLLEDLWQEQQGEVPPGSFLYNHLDAQIQDNLDLGEHELVEGKGRQLIAIDSRRPEGHLALGLALLRQERLEEAADALLRAHELEPDNVPTLHNLGFCYYKLKQFEQAVTWLEHLRQVDEHYLPAYYLMGNIYQEWGQREKAVTFWQQALSVDPDYEPAQYALFKAGAGPEPEETLSGITQQLKFMSPWVKAGMKHPRVYRSDSVTLSLDPKVGFVLEDADNAQNGTVYTGDPFQVGQMDATEIHHFIGVLRMMVKRMNRHNCRDMAILVYYRDQPEFSYQLEVDEDGLHSNSSGRLLSEAPTFLKVRVDSNVENPYGSPFSGYFIYLAQRKGPGVYVSTLGSAVE